MQSVKISGIGRNDISKSAVKALRNDGMVPCVMYGGEAPVHFAVKDVDFNKLIFTPNTYQVELDIEGKTYNAIMKERQYHPLTDRLIHVDFLEVQDDKPVVIGIPVQLTGAAEGVKQGGRLVSKMRKVNVRGLVKDIPDAVEIDITDLDIGDSTRVKDVSIANVELTDQPSNVIVGVRTTRKVEVPVEEVAAEGEAPAEGGEAPAEGAAEEKKEEAQS